MIKNGTQKGFTVIELLIATSVFSTVLLIAATGIVHVGRLFQRGITGSLTQEVARSTIDFIKDDFELSGGYFKRLPPYGANEGFCIGSRLYSYQVGLKIGSNGVGRAMVVRDFPSCDLSTVVHPDDIVTGIGYDLATGTNTDVSGNMREFLGPNMRLNSFSVTPSPAASPKPTGLTISIDVISGDDDLIASGLCRGGPGSEYCSNAPLLTYAVRRLR